MTKFLVARDQTASISEPGEPPLLNIPISSSLASIRRQVQNTRLSLVVSCSANQQNQKSNEPTRYNSDWNVRGDIELGTTTVIKSRIARAVTLLPWEEKTIVPSARWEIVPLELKPYNSKNVASIRKVGLHHRTYRSRRHLTRPKCQQLVPLGEPLANRRRN